MNVQTDVQAQSDQQNTEQEWDTPPPIQQLFVGQRCGEHQEHKVGQHRPRRYANLNPRAVQSTLMFGSMLHGHQYSAAPFPTQGQALDDAQCQQHDRRPDAHRLITRQQADCEGGRTHGQQRDEQHRFTAQAVTEVSE
ncbi:hypothetical protein D3C76_816490 [compost metagenome]